MSINFNTKTYTNDVARGADIYRYLGPDHSANVVETLDLYRTDAPSGVTNGTARSRARAKFTRTATDGTNILLTDAIVDIQVALPDGMDDTEIGALVDDVAAFVATTEFMDLVKKHIINT